MEGHKVSGQPALWEIFSVFLLLSAILVLTFTPWRSDAIDLRDFAEFLPILEARDGLFAEWQGVNDYFETQGRANLLTNGLIVAGWHLADRAPARWQTYQVGLAALAGVALFVVLRRFGASRSVALGLTVACAFAPGPAAATLRLTAELPASALLLIITGAAATATDRSGPSRAIGVAIGSALMLLFKESMVVMLPLVAASVVAGGATRRWKTLTAGATFLLVAGVLWRAVIVAASAPPDAYSRGLTAANINGVTIANAISGLLSPRAWPWVPLVVAFASIPSILWYFSVSLLVILVWRRGGGWLAAAFALSAATGVLLYSAWGRLEMFYSTPFFFALALVGGMEISRLSRKGRLWHGAVIASLVALATVFGTNAWRLKEATFARRSAEYATALSIAALGPERRVVFVVSTLALQEWQNTAATYSRFIEMTWPGRLRAHLSDLSCADAALDGHSALADGAVIYPSQSCGDLPRTGTIQRAFSYFSLAPFGTRTDSFVIHENRITPQ
jgi:hypothetical protein